MHKFSILNHQKTNTPPLLSKQAFFQQIYHGLQQKLTRQQFSFFQGWISSLAVLNKRLMIKKSNLDHQQQNDKYLDRIRPSVMNLKHKQQSICCIKKPIVNTSSMKERKIVKRLLTSATERVGQKHEKTYYDTSETLESFRHVRKINNLVYKKNSREYPIFSGTKNVNSREKITQKKRQSSKLNKKIKYKYYERKLNDFLSVIPNKISNKLSIGGGIQGSNKIYSKTESNRNRTQNIR